MSELKRLALAGVTIAGGKVSLAEFDESEYGYLTDYAEAAALLDEKDKEIARLMEALAVSGKLICQIEYAQKQVLMTGKIDTSEKVLAAKKVIMKAIAATAQGGKDE